MKQERIVGAAAALLAFFGALLLYTFSEIFTPVLIAFIFAYLLDPVVTALERRKVPRALAVVGVFSATAIVIAASGYLFFDAVVSEFRSVSINLPEYANRLYLMIPAEIKARLDIETPEKLYRHIDAWIAYARGASASILRETFAFLTRAFSTTLSFILALLGYLIIPVYLYYLLEDFPKLAPWAYGLVPLRFRSGFHDVVTEVDGVLSAFVRGQLTVCAILAVLYSAGLYFIGIDLAVAIGTLAGITFMIPYFGTILGIVLSVLMALLKFHDILHPLLCVGWFLVVQALEGSMITPNIVGNRVGLNPVIALIAILVMGQAFGLLGMLLAIPVAAVGKILFRRLLSWYRASDYYTRA